MPDPSQVAALRLYRTRRVGPVTYQELMRLFKTPEEALRRLPELIAAGGSKPLVLWSRGKAESELRALEAMGGRLLRWSDKEWPSLLRFSGAPPILLALGYPHLFERKAVAIVGSRNATSNGCRLAERIASDLASAGWLVVSGLARGIDRAAHEGSLLEGTAAVLAGGIDIPYPDENKGLYEKIVASGVIVSEAPMGSASHSRHFPRRNRIVSGISHGTLVVEAAKGSGSLITAGFASEQGRVVMAVPGSPLDERAQGCNALLREGAHLVESSDDVINVLKNNIVVKEYLGEPPGEEIEESPARIPSETEHQRVRGKVLSLLGASPTEIDALAHQSDEVPRLVHLVLLELELSGEIERLAGDKVVRVLSPSTGSGRGHGSKS
ncbi:MAG: DNA-processing protein DprA [Alphaproteobacteria bacterium]